MSCKTCAYPRSLCQAPYCKKDPAVRDLPRPPAEVSRLPQELEPTWCAPAAAQPLVAPCA